MKSLFLALRNILRNKRRTAITFLAIITGSTGIIVFGGYVEDSYIGLREITISTQTGHIQLYKTGYLEEGTLDPAKFLIEDPKKHEEALLDYPQRKYIEMISSRLTFSGLISSGEKTLSCQGIGIDVAKEVGMSAADTLVDGERLAPGVEDEGMLGSELMRALGAEVGDYVTLLTTTVDGTINAADFKIAGVIQTGAKAHDQVFVKLPIQFVQNMLNTNAAEKIVVLLDETKDLEMVMNALDDAIFEKDLELEMQSWDELAEFYHKVVNLYEGIFNVMKVIIGIIVFFSIANTMSMSVFERVKEIGTLRAIGTTRWGITRLFLLEGLLVGVLGGLLGVVVGIAAAVIINVNGGIQISPPPGMTTSFVTNIALVPDVILYAFGLTVCVSSLSSVYPAIKASRLKIVDAITYN